MIYTDSFHFNPCVALMKSTLKKGITIDLLINLYWSSKIAELVCKEQYLLSNLAEIPFQEMHVLRYGYFMPHFLDNLQKTVH